MDLTRLRDRHDRRSFDRWLALALAVFGQVEVWLVLDRPEVPAGTLVMTAAVAFRRSRPMAAVALFVAAYLSQMPFADAGEQVPWVLAQALASFLLAFSLAAHEENGATAVAGALLLVAGFWADALRVGAPAGDYVASLVGVSACWTAGRLLYRERGLARALAAANVRAEHAAAAEERARIARELHDIVGHSLTVIALQADAAQAAFEVQPARTRKAALDAIDRTARQALEDVRRVLELGGVSVLGEAGDGAEAVELVRRHEPDVALMDIQMPGMGGIEATRRIATSGKRTRVLILKTFDFDRFVYEAMVAGASGFLLKDAGREQLLAGVRIVAAGDQLIARGRNNAEIAEELTIGEATVKTHVSRVMAKLGARDRIQVVVSAYELGLVEPGQG